MANPPPRCRSRTGRERQPDERRSIRSSARRRRCSPAIRDSAIGCAGLDWKDAVAANLEGQTVLVTGGNSGIGEAACEGFARGRRRRAPAGRDETGSPGDLPDRSQAPGCQGARLTPEVCDLSDLTHVRRFAESFLARLDRLDVLVNNAGVFVQSRQHTPDGVELTFATNVLGPFLLTSLLLPALLAA